MTIVFQQLSNAILLSECCLKIATYSSCYVMADALRPFC